LYWEKVVDSTETSQFCGQELKNPVPVKLVLQFSPTYIYVTRKKISFYCICIAVFKENVACRAIPAEHLRIKERNYIVSGRA